MSEKNQNKASDSPADEPDEDQPSQSSSENGPTFNESPDPLAGLKKTTTDMMASMDGKSVSMKTYVGTIIGVVVLMLLARCGG